MKQSISAIIATVSISILSFQAQAKVWRVNNNSGASASFTTLQAAQDNSSVLAGDTIQIEPSANNYGNANLNKKLVIIGPGYFLSQNTGLQVGNSSASFNTIYLSSNCSGTVITGITVSDIYCGASNVSFIRNFFNGGYIRTATDGQSSPNVSNILILDNYAVCPILLNGTASNVIIKGNYIINNGNFNSSNTSVTSVLIENNIINQTSSTDLYSCIFRNNIFLGDNKTGNSSGNNNNSYFNNLFEYANDSYNIMSGVTVGNGNLFGNSSYTQANIFNLTGSTDAQWKLKTGSPALGAGVSGGDLGMFAGSNPYVLSGIPSVPTIYLLNTTSSGNGVSVTISTKSNN